MFAFSFKKLKEKKIQESLESTFDVFGVILGNNNNRKAKKNSHRKKAINFKPLWLLMSVVLVKVVFFSLKRFC